MDDIHDYRLNQWYIAFRNAKNGHRWQRWLKSGFQHCYAFTYDAQAKRYIVFDPGWDGITLRAYHPIDFRKMLITIAQTETVLLCSTESKKIFFPRLLMTCSTEIAHLLGMNIFTLTPYRLFCALLKRGGKYSFVQSDTKGKFNG